MAWGQGRNPFATKDVDRHATTGDLRPSAGCVALLLIALASTTVLVVPHRAAGQNYKFQDRKLSDDVVKTEQAEKRCDKERLRKGIDRLKKSKGNLDQAAKSGFVEGAADDAANLGKWIERFEKAFAACKDTYKVTGLSKAISGLDEQPTYGFGETKDRDAANKILDAAQTAAEKCDLIAFERARDEARTLSKQLAVNKDPAADVFDRIFLDLYHAYADVRARCEKKPGKSVETPKKPGTAEVPKGPGTTEPAKTGTGTGNTTPNKPPEPPKAPADSPGTGMAPPAWRLGVFAGAQFDSWKQVSIGSSVNGAAFTGPFLRSRGAGTGFDVGAFAKMSVPSESSLSGQNVLGMPGNTTLKFDFTFYSTESSISGTTSPGQSASFVFLRPFGGINSSFLGASDASIKSSRAGFTLDALWTYDHATGLFKSEIAPAGQGGVQFGIGARYQRTYVGHDARITSATFPGETHALMLDTYDNYLGPVFQLGYNCQRGPWSFGVQHTSSFNLRFTNGTAQQDSVIPGFSPSTFGLKVSKSTAGFAYIGGIDVRAGYDLAPGMTLGVNTGFLFNSAESHWQVPVDPGEATRMRTSTQLSGNLGAYFRWSF